MNVIYVELHIKVIMYKARTNLFFTEHINFEKCQLNDQSGKAS